MAAADEDERLGLLLRAIRRRSEMTQVQLATEVGVPRDDVIAVEAGRASEVQLGRLRRMFAGVDARLRTTAWWHGAAADRLLDERHARIVERAASVYLRWSWLTAVEATFAKWGERGSIDLLAVHPPTRSAAANEIKASFGSMEETNRSVDVKARLAPKLVEDRFGWRPLTVSRVLVLPDDDTLRRVVARHVVTMASAYPARSREVRAWMRNPTGALRGIWFLSEVAPGDKVSG